MKKFLLLFISILTFSFLFTTNKTYAVPQGETWIINQSINVSTLPNTTTINFTSNGMSFSAIHYYSGDEEMPSMIYYDSTTVWSMGTWIDEVYRTITFETAPTGDLLTWLQANAVKVLVSNDGYDEGYQDGYNDGYEAGRNDGYNEGRDDGYDDGYDEGYQDGYDDGLLAGDYQEGYQEGYQDGFIAGEKSKIAKNNESFYNRIAILIPAVITVVALASIISYFGLKRKNE